MKLPTLVALLTLALSFAHRATSAEHLPNIIFIFIDDQGYYDLGCYGATEIETPRIDAMARAVGVSEWSWLPPARSTYSLLVPGALITADTGNFRKWGTAPRDWNFSVFGS